MKKYITPAVEVQTVALCNNIMAVSFKVKEGDTTEQLSRDNLWYEDEDEF